MPSSNDATPGFVSLLRDVRDGWADDPGAAIDRLDEALRPDGASIPRAWTPSERARLEARRGQLRIFLGRLDPAIVDLRRAARTDDDDPYVTLQLASGLRWRGAAADWPESERLAGVVRAAATRSRSGPLAIAAHCLLGEIALEQRRPDDAVRAFGAALGISEFASSEAVTVAPLAGLALAHLRGRAPRKAEPMAVRALDRADRAGDQAGRSRALQALAEARVDRATWVSAVEAAERAPHLPLALAARVALAEVDGRAPDALRDALGRVGARHLARRLARIGPSSA